MSEIKKAVIPRTKVISSINSHLLPMLPIKVHHEQFTFKPSDLLTPCRFDLLAKYLYAKHKHIGSAMEWATHVYKEHLRAFGGFHEGDHSGKNNFLSFKESFDKVLDAIQQDGFIDDISLVPIGRDRVIIDGSHRLAACLFYQKPIDTVYFDTEPACYDFSYFIDNGLSLDIADAMALEYCRLNSKMLIAVIFPVARDRDDEIQEILEEYGQIAYKKQIQFSKIGRHNLIRQLYRNESWLGRDGEITTGLRHHVEKRFLNTRSVKFFFLVCSDISRIKEAKARIRALFDLENDSIHINDTHKETLRIAEQILTPNSVHFMNHAQPWLSKNFSSMFKEYQREIKKQNMNKDSLCIDSGSVLAVYGLRDTADLDYLHFENEMALNVNSKISAHNAELVYHAAPLGDLLFDPRNYFYYDGMKFLSLSALRKMKEKRNEAKDIKDMLLIDSLQDDVPNMSRFWRNMRFFFKKFYEGIIHFELWKIKNVIPESWHPIARRVYHAPFYFSQSFGPLNRKINYKGFILNYRRGTSLIFRIHTGKTYEPELTWKILEMLKRKEHPVFMDIGANIGLITLNVLGALPHARVFAFEPGPHQYSLFKKTILENGLEQKVFLFGEALGHEVGDAYFNVHNTKDASGDGFFDTGRSGDTVKIKVPVNTLDCWWIGANKPHIDVVKMDAEGAEHWILMGAVGFLNECRPVIFLEISDANLKMYPYGMEDIVEHLGKCRYELRTLGGDLVQFGQIREVAKTTQDFIATHISNT